MFGLTLYQTMQLVVLVFLIVMSCLMSMSETSLMAVSAGKMYRLKAAGSKRAVLILSLLHDRDRLLRAILCGNTAANIFAASVFSNIMYPIYGDDGVLYASIVLTIVILLVGEILPKTYAARNPGRVALLLAPMVSWFVRITSPFTYVLNFIVNIAQKILRIDRAVEVSSMAEDVRGLIAMYSTFDLRVHYDLKMLGSIIELQDTEVSQVMTHRTAVFTVNMSDSEEEILRKVAGSSFSRIPVWEGNPDNVVGILYMRNLSRLALAKKNITRQDILDSCFEPWYIPDTVSLRDQLLEFRKRKIHFAVIINEYGVFQGIVTLEDIMEQIVGSIYDEHDIEKKMLINVREGEYMADGSLSIRDLNRETGIKLHCESAATIGGFILHVAERLPDIGECFVVAGTTLKVVAIKDNKVSVVHIQTKSGPEE